MHADGTLHASCSTLAHAVQTTVSLPSTFKFRSSNRRSFGLQAYSVMTVYSNGHLKFGVHQSSRFRNFRVSACCRGVFLLS